MYGLDFGESQRVETRRGTVYVLEAAPTDHFSSAYRQNKDEVKAAGFSLRKYHDEWVVSYWSDRSVPSAEAARVVLSLVIKRPDPVYELPIGNPVRLRVRIAVGTPISDSIRTDSSPRRVMGMSPNKHPIRCCCTT